MDYIWQQDRHQPLPKPLPHKPKHNSPQVCSKAPILHRARIDRVLQKLSDFKKTDETRAFLYQQFRHNNQYCGTCSPHHMPGLCGRTCALLHPYKQDFAHLDQVWVQEVHADHGRFLRLIADMKKHGYNAEPERVTNWEHAAEELRMWARSALEVNDEAGWRWTPEVRMVVGMQEGWSLEEAYGKGPDLEEDHAPEDVDR